MGNTHTKQPNSVKNVTIKLPTKVVSPNDKITKKIFSVYPDNLNKGRMQVIEGRAKIPVLVDFMTADFEKIEPYTREVAMACFAIFEYGNIYATIEQIYRVMTGDTKARLSAKAEKKILTSLQRLIVSPIRLDISNLRTLNYKTSKSELIGTILPAQFVTNVIVNGGTAKTVVKFLAESPLVTVAKIKNHQLLTYNLANLAVGGSNSDERIAIRNYTLRRIEECRLHAQLPNVVTFDDLFRKNHLLNKRKEEKLRYRKYLKACFDAWKAAGVIADYRIILKDRVPYAISFSF